MITTKVWQGTDASADGTTVVEYAIAVVLIALVVIGAVATLGSVTRENLCSPSEQLGAESDGVDFADCPAG